MNAVSAAVKRVVRGPQASLLLTKCGIDPKRFWLLMDVFSTLSQRREVLGNLGRDRATLKGVAVIYGLITALVSVASVMAQPHVQTYLLIFLAMTAFILFSVLISETSNSLMNPVEGLILAHQPIDGATYTFAKLTHLLRIVLYFVAGLNVAPALAGLALKGASWIYPLEHMLAAFATGCLLALVCCGVFGWLLRFVPAPRLKAAGRMAELLPTLAFVSFRFTRTVVSRFHAPAWFTDHWPVQAAFGAIICGLAALGIRSLSGDYLVRVSSIAHGRPAAKKRAAKRWSPIGEGIARLFGGQAARAGFEYVRRMMVRDWQFKRQLMGILPSLAILASGLPRGLKISPFSGQFSPMHFTPHVFGFLLLSICAVLAFGSDYKGAWIFLLTPGQAFGRFARGIHASLWLLLVMVPHVFLLALLIWAWGVRDACLVTAYSAAASSLYLGLELRLIKGVPFGKQVQSSRGAFMLPLMLSGLFIAGIAVAFQYFLLFQSRTTVAIATILLAGAAAFVTRSSLTAFVVNMRFSLGLVSSQATLLYREVD